MTITYAEYTAILAAGIEPADKFCELSPFACACYDMNTVSDLLECLQSGDACVSLASDCESWDITPDQWRHDLRAVLEVWAFKYAANCLVDE